MTALLYILLCLIWGSTWMAIKIGLQDAPPMTAAALRFIAAIIILHGLVMIKRYPYPRGWGKILRLAYPGLYMYGTSYAMIYLAEQYITSALTSVLFASFPLFVALLSLRILRTEHLSIATWLGLFTGFIGIVVIAYDSLQVSDQLFLGSLLALGGSATAAYGMLLHKKHFAHENILISATIQMTLGGIPLILWALAFDPWPATVFSARSLGSIIYLAVLGSVVAFVAYYWLLRHTRAVVVSLIAFVTPLVGVFIGVGLYSETFTALTVVGTALILGGVVLAIKS